MMYYRGLGASITNPYFSFTDRNKRPPRDPVNACLSFGYTLLLRTAESMLQKAGLDIHLGAIHGISRKMPSLALDFIEEFRPVVVDRVVLSLINRRQLAVEDFEDPYIDFGAIGAPIRKDEEEQKDKVQAVYLGPVGKAVFLKEFYAQWRRKLFYLPRDKRFTLKDIMEIQAFNVANAISDNCDYSPFLLQR